MIQVYPRDPVIDPTVHDYVDISFQWRVKNRGTTGTLLLGGRLIVRCNGVEIYRVDPGEHFSTRGDEPRYMVQYVGFLSEVPPGSVSVVLAWLQVGVENLRGTGPYDVVVQIADTSQVVGSGSPPVLEYVEPTYFSVSA